MLRYLLDTNICIYVIKRRPQALLDTFNRHAGQMAMSAITFSELLHGVEKSAAPARNEGLTLVSNNLREFERVPGLLLENWA
jgi:predicted nucleic acid-binding protein